jgi:hypothetical protein
MASVVRRASPQGPPAGASEPLMGNQRLSPTKNHAERRRQQRRRRSDGWTMFWMGLLVVAIFLLVHLGSFSKVIPEAALLSKPTPQKSTKAKEQTQKQILQKSIENNQGIKEKVPKINQINKDNSLLPKVTKKDNAALKLRLEENQALSKKGNPQSPASENNPAKDSTSPKLKLQDNNILQKGNPPTVEKTTQPRLKLADALINKNQESQPANKNSQLKLQEPAETKSQQAAYHVNDKKPQISSPALYPMSNGTAPFAYVFYLGGIPSAPFRPTMRKSDHDLPRRDDYRGLVYNILVSVKILRDGGSIADFVLLVNMVDGELADTDVSYLHALGIRILYTPSTLDFTNEIMTVPFEKFRVLELVEYKRVLYLDPDVTPRCNFYYLMQLSIEGKLLKDHVLISLGDVPSSSRFFIVTPRAGEFWNLVNLIPSRTRDTVMTWGWGFRPTRYQTMAGEGTGYAFEGGNSDQGLLLEYAKYQAPFWHAAATSIVIGPEIQNWQAGNTNQTNLPREQWTTGGKSPQQEYLVNEAPPRNALLEHSCLPAWHAEALRGQDVAPYRDFELWKTYPWNQPMAPSVNSDQRLAVTAGSVS